MNILITGGAGFIGSHLAKLHLSLGDNVWIIDNLLTGSKQNLDRMTGHTLKFYEADITTFDLNKLPRMDLVYHLASPASPVQYKKHPVETLLANSVGSYRLMEWLKSGHGHRLVLASTSEVYGDPLVHPQVETYWGNVNSVGVRACYDEAKRFAEAIVTTYLRKYQIDVRVARIFNTYGPNMEKNDGRIISNFVIQALTNKPITVYGDGQQTRSFCFVADLVKGLHLLGAKDSLKGEIVNLGNPDERTVLEMAKLIKQLTDSSSEIVFQPIEDDDPKKRKPDITKAKTLLDWEPKIGLEDGLKQTINYFKERYP
ncbi:hypothetical protein A3F03_00915 [Candidatus Roizmanbacteria bacterium RIFCSPHIGHO2_12_FULL_41_11]|uniref:NAD-dependent epimerase/dehydratase domain-containing protein n=2 Tax=Candidatus Roizmaniibacteriota TaxID=1752723 RepID=A0A1F7J8F5_9BACT|nr:MAG: hypothetical protein A3F03_00915 [Candidatus Roizmanbacteria bacterium RIFCSPHIGHO2_12_FULL_41_11]OGK51895.1 MAG: hypothetical protein A2966_00760 [Candidatus Roizmanbacteria bacterium RIFCSPLOWO2_01_FULL_41_22]